MRMVLAAAFLATVSATPALAQEPAAGNFTGGHVEILGGLDSSRADDGAGNDVSANGAFYGIAGGWDFQSGNGVFGIEVEASESTADFCEAGLCVEAGRDLYVGGRAGAVLGERALLYVKVGYSNARIHLEDAATGDTIDGTNLDGVRGGLGLEWDTGSPLVARIEYRYSNYEDGFSRHQGVIGLGLRFR